MSNSTSGHEESASRSDPADELERFADGEISARHGRVNKWLMIVYAIMFVWAIYYGITYWGGLGPGLEY